MFNVDPQYPNGKLNDNDEGVLQIALSISDGAVCLHFGKPVAWLGMGAKEARELAQLLLKHADALDRQTGA